jgi:hypothetical protein
LAELAVAREPQWLTARRERAAELRDSLDLPRHKGKAGWEFTELGNTFALEAFPPVAPGEGDAVGAADVEHVLEVPEDAIELVQVDGRVLGEPDAVEDGPVILPLTLAVERHPRARRAAPRPGRGARGIRRLRRRQRRELDRAARSSTSRAASRSRRRSCSPRSPPRRPRR